MFAWSDRVMKRRCQISSGSFPLDLYIPAAGENSRCFDLPMMSMIPRTRACGVAAFPPAVCSGWLPFVGVIGACSYSEGEATFITLRVIEPRSPDSLSKGSTRSGRDLTCAYYGFAFSHSDLDSKRLLRIHHLGTKAHLKLGKSAGDWRVSCHYATRICWGHGSRNDRRYCPRECFLVA